MPGSTIEERLSNVELALAEFIIQTNKVIHRMEKDTQALKEEMREFKEEMRGFKEEMREVKEERKGIKEKPEEYKPRIEKLGSDFTTRAIEDRREMNKMWAKLAKKWGTLTRDVFAPAIESIVEKYFGQEVLEFMSPVWRRRKELNLEEQFEIILATEQQIFLVDTIDAGTPDEKHLIRLAGLVDRFRKLFPEYKKLPVVPILAGLRFDESLYQPAAEKGILLLGFREWEYLDFLNFDLLHPKAA